MRPMIHIKNFLASIDCLLEEVEDSLFVEKENLGCKISGIEGI